MSRNFPYYRWFPKDYCGDAAVQAMTDDQDLAYRRLLDKSWELGPLPNDIKKLAAYARYAPARFEQCWGFPLTECWHENKDGKLINNRLEDERDFAYARANNARKAAVIGWKIRDKRLKKQRVKKASSRNAPALLPLCDSDAIKVPMPVPVPDKEKKKKRAPPAPSEKNLIKGTRRSAPRGPANPYPFTIFWDHKEQRIKVEEVDLIIEHFTSWAQSNNCSGLNIREILRQAQPGFERHAIQEGYFKVSPDRLTLLFAKWAEKDILTQGGRKQYAEDPFDEAIRKAEEEEEREQREDD